MAGLGLSYCPEAVEEGKAPMTFKQVMRLLELLTIRKGNDPVRVFEKNNRRVPSSFLKHVLGKPIVWASGSTLNIREVIAELCIVESFATRNTFQQPRFLPKAQCFEPQKSIAFRF